MLNLYKHINAPEARMYLSRQLYEEALHVQFYLTLLDTYIPDLKEREKAFAAIHNVPSIKAKADFCFRWIDSIQSLERIETPADRRRFLLNLICFACCIEGLFFFAAFAYVYFMRSKGLLNGLASGTNWVFPRRRACTCSSPWRWSRPCAGENPELFDDDLNGEVERMLEEAVDCEMQFADDILGQGVPGMSIADMRQYLEFVADQRLSNLGLSPRFGSKNPFSFLDLQDVQELSNFFERRVSAYQVGVTGEVSFDESF